MRARRRVVAVAACALGVLDLTLAVAHRSPVNGSELFELPLGAVHGARYSLLLLGVGLLWAARGLVWGQRTTWWLAVACASLSVLAHGVKRFDLVGLAAAVSVTILLLAWRRSFTASPDPLLARRALRVLAAGEAATLAYGTIGLYLLDTDVTRSADLTGVAVAAGRRMVLLPASGLTAATRHGEWFLTSIPVLSLSIVAVTLTMLLRPLVAGPSRRRTEQQDVRKILSLWGSTALAHFHLLPDKRYLFSQDRSAFIGYKVIGRVALALGEPIGPPTQRPAAARDFVAMCDRNGWLPAFHQLTQEGAAELAATIGLRSLMIGEEAVVDVTTFSLGDSRNKSIRSAVRRVERAGLHLVELPAPLSDTDLTDLRSVSDAWMAHGGHRERTFTLGQFDADQLRGSTVLALRNGAGETAAFVSLVPTYQSTLGNFDLMRRRPESPNGTMDLLFVSLIDRFRAEQRGAMTLGLAPLSGINADGAAERALKLVYDHGGRAFNFVGLRSFKAKWHPQWEPRYLGYRRDSDLPRIALAVARAGELKASTTPGRRALSATRRLPGSALLLGLIGALMLATAVRPALQASLVAHLGLRYAQLLHGQVWRLMTAPLIQPRPGMLWSNIAILALALPAAELRLGWRRMLATCFLADTASTLAALTVLRLASTRSAAAAIALHSADTGSSSLAWGAAAAFIASLSSRRQRLTAGGVLVLALVGALVVRHGLDDAQHILAAAIGAALTLTPRISTARLHPGGWLRRAVLPMSRSLNGRHRTIA